MTEARYRVRTKGSKGGYGAAVTASHIRHTHGTCDISYLDATVLARVLSVEALLGLALVFIRAVRVIHHAVVHTPVHLGWGWEVRIGCPN